MKKMLHLNLRPVLCASLALASVLHAGTGRAQFASFTRAFEVTGPLTRTSNNNSGMIVTPFYGTPISQLDNRGYLLASNVDNGNGGFVVKLTAVKTNGDQVWSKTYGDFTANIRCFSVTRDARDNGYVLTGYKSNTVDAKRRDYLWLLKVDGYGNALKEYSFSADSIPCFYSNGQLIAPCHSFAHPSIYGTSIIQVSQDPDSAKNGDFVVAGFLSESPAVENYTTLKRNFVWRFRVAAGTPPTTDTFAAAEPLTRFLKVYHSWGNAGSDNQPTSEDFATDLQEVAGHGIMVLGHVTGAPVTPTPPSVVRRPYYALLNYDGGGSSVNSSVVFKYADYTNTADIKNVRTVYGSDDAIYMLGYYYPAHSFTVTPIKTTAGAAGLTRIYYSSAATDMPGFSMLENNANSSELVVMGYRLKPLSSPGTSIINFVHPYTIRVTKGGTIVSKFNLDSIKSSGYINYTPANPDSNRDYFRPFENSAFPLAAVPGTGTMDSHMGKNDAAVAGVLYGSLGTIGNHYNATLSQFQQISNDAECHSYQLPPLKDSILLSYNTVSFNINNVSFKATRYSTVVTNTGTDHLCAQIQPTERKAVTGLAENNNDQFAIYPNPAAEAVTLESGTDRAFTYKITNITGAVISSGSFVRKTILSVGNWADGIYLVHITGESGWQKVYKFVKQ
ncbi:T9SS type A sorting domain-containing protein [Chitinophagaceae bacterium MMS25-I14]